MRSEFHRGAADWLVTALSGPELTGLSWVTILAFLRIGTHRRMPAQPFTSAEAVAIEHGAVLYTYDRDFTRFPGLKWSDPLDAS
ncbi:MAG TPA: hypothetical protein VMQ86_02785 [Bryobacteraceae bacterium]|nr:hypothetical protein [Bryobacteraceae bacterium]